MRPNARAEQALLGQVRDDRYGLRSVKRALRLIEAVAAGPPAGLSLTDISRQLNVAKSTALAAARTLVEAGFLRATEPGPHYKLGTVLIRYGDLAAQQSPVGDVCLPVLREASAVTGMTSRLAVADDGYAVCVNRVDGPGVVRFQAPLGRREPPHATALGKSVLAMQGTERIRQICFESTLAPYTPQTITDPEALIAELMTVRRRGYAVDDEEELMGIFCVGAPFFGHSGSCAGALSVTGIKKSLPQWKLAELGGLLRNLADEASQFLGGPRFDQLPTGQFSQELTQAAEHETAGPGRQKSSLWGR
jgi:IclR family acetate operon transcriptional repressor